ncbi:Dynein regulatory complex subunit 2 [Eumeta japonica]|uniref:Dynein regulatory complex subunit 2 n=1 Tax=Eumeta variegata TaxID=151549 RepID=A0A4C1W660_EUMVA|nr:Dynein regulatory complex subunit 2 [Eumeta japonica]
MPKKKGKVNKLARMSDEERARYLQHRADMEEEARRRKQELVARFIKNKLEKEEKFSRMNTAKLNQSWRVVLRKNKCKEMETDINGMMGSFQFMVERKDRLLASLVQNLHESDEQHRRIFQAHAESLGKFLEIGAQRLDQLQEEYEHQKNALLENWDKEFLEQSANQERAEFKLQLIIFKKNQDFQQYKSENTTAMATAKNDARLEVRAAIYFEMS